MNSLFAPHEPVVESCLVVVLVNIDHSGIVFQEKLSNRVECINSGQVDIF
jgi:hypothetical protein